MIFADPARVNLDDLWHSLCDASIQGCLVAAWKPSNGAIRDVVAAFALTPTPANDPELPSVREEVAQIGRQIDSGAQDSTVGASRGSQH